MREIKFRVWSPYKEMMSYDVNLFSNGWVTCVHDDGDESKYGSQNVVPLMQYTGLKDKNLKEIYEGDIIKITHEDGYSENYTIQYMAHNDYPAFDTVPSIDCDANGLSHAKACCETEIIGNIYQNSELLKVNVS